MNYNFVIEKDGETGECLIEWKGPRSNWFAGPNCFDYFVKSFSDNDSTYIDELPCIGCVVVKDLSRKKINILRLVKLDPGQSPCKYYFKIEYDEY